LRLVLLRRAGEAVHEDDRQRLLDVERRQRIDAVGVLFGLGRRAGDHVTIAVAARVGARIAITVAIAGIAFTITVTVAIAGIAGAAIRRLVVAACRAREPESQSH
jgi:hypothetical protein